MVFGKVVDVEPVTTDRYGRIVALVKVEGQSLNEGGLLKAGLAWVYTKYLPAHSAGVIKRGNKTELQKMF